MKITVLGFVLIVAIVVVSVLLLRSYSQTGGTDTNQGSA